MSLHGSMLFVLAFGLDILLDAILFHFLPGISRRDIFFAVTAKPEFRETTEGRAILRRYRGAVWSQSVVAAAVVTGAIAARKPVLGLIGVVWQIAAVLWAFLRARKRTMPHAAAAETRREAALVPRPASGAWFALLQIGPFAILAASAIYIQVIWDRIPARFPIHWGLDGRPNGWATRSFAGIYGFWLIGLLICVLLEVFAYGIVHWTRQVRSSGADARNEAHFRRVQAGCIIAMEYFFALLFNGIPFMAFRHDMNQEPGVLPFLIGTFGFIAVLVGILIHTGQGGANLTAARTSSDIVGAGKVIGDRTPDACWRAGMFYVNPDDPAILVEKRFGIGYTLNFAHRTAWVPLLFIPGVLFIVFFVAGRR